MSNTAAPIQIQDRVEMFVDNSLIYESFNTQLRMHSPERKEIVLRMEEPWEGPGSGIYATVLRDHEGLFRMYYRGVGVKESKSLQAVDRSSNQYTCLALSEDGLHWTKPVLSQTSIKQNKKNNIVFSGVQAHNFSPFLDGNDTCTPENRYKAIAGHAPEGLMAYTSPDGYQWKQLQKDPIITDGAFDSHNTCFYDRNIRSYRCYSRYFAVSGSDRKVKDFSDLCIGTRAIQSCLSADMLNWGKQHPNTYDENVPLEHFYTNSTIPCPQAEHIYVSFPMRFMPERYKVSRHPIVGISDAVFMTSRDGVHFTRLSLDSWIRPDTDERNWTQRNYITAWGILETAPDEFSLFVGEHYGWDDAYIRRYSIRKHGFASIYAPYESGVCITEPLIFKGNRLFLNYATAAVGSIRVGIVSDSSGWPAKKFSTEECDILYGNETDCCVTWRGSGDVSCFEGKPVRLKFEMKAADLYALKFGVAEKS